MDYAHRALMLSPGHRADILDPRFSRIGLGVCRDAQGRFWVTEMFLADTFLSRRPAPAPPPRPGLSGGERVPQFASAPACQLPERL